MSSLDKHEKRFIAFALLFMALALAPFVLGKDHAPECALSTPTDNHAPLVVRADTWERLEGLATR